MRWRQLVVALFACSSFMGVACEKKGPMESAGEEIDEAVEDAGDAIEDATDPN